MRRQLRAALVLFLITVASVAKIAAAENAAAKEAQANRKPNIVFIVGDDMGYADVGVHGCRDIPTPHLDALAHSGIRFTNGYVSGPYCSPTRAGLLTGRYQQRFGHEFNPGPAPRPNVEPGLPLAETTLADRLRAVGYATALVGKWHLGYSEKQHPQSRGFDEFFGFLGGAHGYLPNRGGEWLPILRGRESVDEPEYLTDAFAREAVAYIKERRDKPFFLYLAFNAVHAPMHATAEREKRFAAIADPRRRKYAAMMSAMDDAVGNVTAALRERKLDEQTFVCFISDNGGPPVNSSSNAPLRGRKSQTLEGGIRVPFFVKWKGKLPEGKTDDRPVIQLDLCATALAVAGVARPKVRPLDGVDLLPFLTGEKTGAPHERLYWRFGEQMAIREGDLKLVKWNDESASLFDLGRDVGEQRNLASERPEDVKRLQVAWDAWNKELVKPLWTAPGDRRAANSK